jgi:hypothetical protein
MRLDAIKHSWNDFPAGNAQLSFLLVLVTVFDLLFRSGLYDGLLLFPVDSLLVDYFLFDSESESDCFRFLEEARVWMSESGIVVLRRRLITSYWRELNPSVIECQETSSRGLFMFCRACNCSCTRRSIENKTLVNHNLFLPWDVYDE